MRRILPVAALAAALPTGGCKPTPLTATIAPAPDASGNVVFEIDGPKNTPIACSFPSDRSTSCPATGRTDAKGHASIAVDPSKLSITSDTIEFSAVPRNSVILRFADHPVLKTYDDFFSVLGGSCSGEFQWVPQPRLKASGCDASTPGWDPPAVAKTAIAEVLVDPEKNTEAIGVVPIQVQFGGAALSGKLSPKRATRAKALRNLMESGAPIPNADREAPVHAVVVWGDSTSLKIIGTTAGTIGGLHLFAKVEDRKRPSQVQCKYVNARGEHLTGNGFFTDADVKVIDRSANKVLAEKSFQAVGTACDEHQEVKAGSTKANNSGAWYRDADVDRFVQQVLAAQK
jgi:hypothetical protein